MLQGRLLAGNVPPVEQHDGVAQQLTQHKSQTGLGATQSLRHGGDKCHLLCISDRARCRKSHLNAERSQICKGNSEILTIDIYDSLQARQKLIFLQIKVRVLKSDMTWPSKYQ